MIPVESLSASDAMKPSVWEKRQQHRFYKQASRSHYKLEKPNLWFWTLMMLEVSLRHISTSQVQDLFADLHNVGSQ